jgi:predicted house-cleaning noncanonical NTP pyrophosphatase (MazG superfamily)
MPPDTLHKNTEKVCYSGDMPKFKFGKLVRDKIVDHQIASGAIPTYRSLSNSEHKVALVEKIIEEAQEILQAGESEVAAEIADVQQAIDDLREKFGLSANDITGAQALKNDKNGAFKKGIYVEHVEVPADDDWVAYYKKNADRYPEITN